MVNITYEISIKDMITSAHMDSAIEESVKKSAMLVERMMKDEARQTFKKPTGRYLNSITSVILKDSAIIAPSVNYALFLEKGVGPSQGRYVPVLQRRIKTGIHPGYKGYFLVEKVKEKSKPEIQNLVNKIIGERLKL